MSFKIVQNDIVRVKADAIVNTANPYPVIGDGTDADIYEAAGSENLLRERVKIGNIARGDAKALLETGRCSSGTQLRILFSHCQQ